MNVQDTLLASPFGIYRRVQACTGKDEFEKIETSWINSAGTWEGYARVVNAFQLIKDKHDSYTLHTPSIAVYQVDNVRI